MADRALARKVLETDAAAILALIPRLDHRFEHVFIIFADQIAYRTRRNQQFEGQNTAGPIRRRQQVLRDDSLE